MSKRGGKAAVKQVGKKQSNPHLDDLLAIRQALNLIGERKFEQARKLCLDVLAHAPQLVFANHAMGLIESTLENYAEAEVWLQKAVQADPQNAEYLTNLGIAQLRQDKIDESIKRFEAAIAIDTEHAAARIGLADALHEKADPEASIAYFEEAVAREPDSPGALTHLAKALIDAGRHKEAVDKLFQAMAMQINYAPAHTNLGIAFQEMGMLDEAVQSHITAQMLDGENIYALNKLADAYIKQRDFEKAYDIYRRVIELAPNDPNSHLKLGTSMYNFEGRYDEAMVLFDKALKLNPDLAMTHNNVGATQYAEGLIDEGIAAMEKALELRPNYKTVRHNLSLAKLLKGDYKNGWANHEIRLTLPERAAVYVLVHRLFKIIPQWDGKSSLKGKNLMLMHEQGFGDTIQFVRYVRILLDQGVHVAVHVVDGLERLFRTLPPEVKLVKHSDKLPNCDASYLMMSLPLALGTDSVEKIPSYPSYLSATADDTFKWKQFLANKATVASPKLRVGLVWAGNPDHGSDLKRSIPLDVMAPLLELKDVQFISLQKGGKPGDLERLEKEFRIINAGQEFTDFADTAGMIANLDLVISVDTSVVHLAGALGAPTWTLVAYTPDWRWLLDREDSPWYPSMRLFRQKKQGDWPGVIAGVKAELQKMLEAR
ncbi:tetratricopeptide repeat protein [Oxalobacteraceae bacterium CAVE-383]|nr:tetratricopeptide repeat protein [Oxalobacteraceae bacterium CAVE-383]